MHRARACKDLTISAPLALQSIDCRTNCWYSLGKMKSIPNAGICLALTRKQAAEALGISVESVDALVLRGLLKPSRALRRPLFSVKELERFLRDTTAEVLP